MPKREKIYDSAAKKQNLKFFASRTVTMANSTTLGNLNYLFLSFFKSFLQSDSQMWILIKEILNTIRIKTNCGDIRPKFK